MMTKTISIVSSLAALAFLTLCLCPASGAQQTLGVIAGTVMDASGGAVADTVVTIGSYTLTFSHDGFQSQRIPGITVQADRTVTLNVTLKVGEVGSTVTVEASPLLNAVD